jgi:hypothetical protein
MLLSSLPGKLHIFEMAEHAVNGIFDLLSSSQDLAVCQAPFDGPATMPAIQVRKMSKELLLEALAWKTFTYSGNGKTQDNNVPIRSLEEASQLPKVAQ